MASLSAEPDPSSNSIEVYYQKFINSSTDLLFARHHGLLLLRHCLLCQHTPIRSYHSAQHRRSPVPQLSSSSSSSSSVELPLQWALFLLLFDSNKQYSTILAFGSEVLSELDVCFAAVRKVRDSRALLLPRVLVYFGRSPRASSGYFNQSHHGSETTDTDYSTPTCIFQIFAMLACLLIVVSGEYYALEGHEEVVEHDAYPKYKYEYGVEDHHTGDHKSQWEHRDGEVVLGSYSLAEADGTHRVVTYNADNHNGFQAQVQRVGHAQHPHGESYSNIEQDH
ncbi:uncharacterized protein LOC131679883 [Topomyia yanbarensis]|uniref:uncharacterized protein LOC131679883 n=1 Tax=Topomyia yanbarensis TaxID=2498891 RepID=UPI00273CE3E4|nr:uncharacterized protein LOC131679883 [Topomyia yanbarensis]